MKKRTAQFTIASVAALALLALGGSALARDQARRSSSR